MGKTKRRTTKRRTPKDFFRFRRRALYAESRRGPRRGARGGRGHVRRKLGFSGINAGSDRRGGGGERRRHIVHPVDGRARAGARHRRRVARSDWLLFNDFCINPVDFAEVGLFVCDFFTGGRLTSCPFAGCHDVRRVQSSGAVRVRIVDKPPPPPLPPSPITATLYRRLTLNPNLPKYGQRARDVPVCAVYV